MTGYQSKRAAAQDKLAQPAQEPVAYYHPHKGFCWAKPTYIAAPTIVDVQPLALYTSPQRTWVGLMLGVRVEGDSVVISVKGGNNNARLLCGELLREAHIYAQRIDWLVSSDDGEDSFHSRLKFELAKAKDSNV